MADFDVLEDPTMGRGTSGATATVATATARWAPTLSRTGYSTSPMSREAWRWDRASGEGSAGRTKRGRRDVAAGGGSSGRGRGASLEAEDGANASIEPRRHATVGGEARSLTNHLPEGPEDRRRAGSWRAQCSAGWAGGLTAVTRRGTTTRRVRCRPAWVSARTSRFRWTGDFCRCVIRHASRFAMTWRWCTSH